ncbi:MAG TPA: hypothetical protein DD420_16530 [Streptomyces sp.]|nr:hypothetical protein [Streptomyces sp.]
MKVRARRAEGVQKPGTRWFPTSLSSLRRPAVLRKIRAAGFEVDAAYWPGEGAAECTQCHAGCTDSPVNT